MATINIRIDKKGNGHFEVNGVEGSSCEEITDVLMRSLGEEEETEYKEEYVQELPDYVEQFQNDND